MRIENDHDAIEAMGGPTKVGEFFGITQGAVSQWDEIPPARRAPLYFELKRRGHEVAESFLLPPRNTRALPESSSESEEDVDTHT